MKIGLFLELRVDSKSITLILLDLIFLKELFVVMFARGELRSSGKPPRSFRELGSFIGLIFWGFLVVLLF